MANSETPDPPQPAIDAHGEPNVQARDPQTEVALAAAEPQAKPSKQCCEITCNKKRDWVDWATLALEGFGLAVLIAYTIFSALLWRTANQALVEGRDTNANQLAKLTEFINEAKRGNQIAIDADRPWIGTGQIQSQTKLVAATDDKGAPFIQVEYMWQFGNGGKRAARIEKVRTTGYWFNSCTDNPNYDTPLGGHSALPRKGKATGRGIIIPDSQFGSAFSAPVPRDKWKLVDGLRLDYCIYAYIEYRDVAYPDVVHHTKQCRFYSPVVQTFAECTNNYADAD